MEAIIPPRNRRCERCGRVDSWDSDAQTWVAANERGSPHCLHEWDINGTYNPVEGQ